MDTSSTARRKSTASSVAASGTETRPRRVRPSRARGLRTSTGCLTCRRRRIKCDEGKPKCAQCCKSDRGCEYAQPAAPEEALETRHRSQSVVSTAADQDLPDDYLPGLPNAAEGTTDSGVVVTPPVPKDAPASTATAAVAAAATAHPVDFATPFVPSFDPADPCGTTLGVEETLQPSVSDADLGFSPLALSQTSLLNISPFEWYDLLAQDAINNIQRLNSLSGGETRWAFDESTLSRRQSPIPESPRDGNEGPPGFGQEDAPVTQPWNTTSNIELSESDLAYFRYYVDVVGPILDLFDPERHFSNVVPHLAVRNIGLLKSILAVAARHMSLGSTASIDDGPAPSNPPSPDTSYPGGGQAETEPARMATQFYYETLQYLSHTLLYPSYANSHEILATAIMISTYEMFDADGPSTNGDWERHLRGAFWIQRSQNNNGESADGLRRAVWWAWLRQDIWAAFRSGRRTLTIFQPQRRIRDLGSDELVTRILFIAAKCVEYASRDADAAPVRDLQHRLNHGNRLLRSLEEWRQALPASFAPISAAPTPVPETASAAGIPFASSPTSSAGHSRRDSVCASSVKSASKQIFHPVWIHPPSHAGAMQMYHFARAIVLLAQPTTGGLNAYRQRQRSLTESLHTVCGIANSCRDTDPAMAFVNVQAVFAVGQCAQDKQKQSEILPILDRALAISKFPVKGLTQALRRLWDEGV
ncbi:Transcriptional regulatory protein moc3 [Colletotrichum higginsianum]|uniref:Transcriptional regulatory protein moc3 n=1 Tax=Colletotrichum higginsianum TaxID=80884 RepID=A0A4T0WK53_9PEZI|nr:Transcriptional regulatory protein moc3 [Colletotrichum higginsianum]